MEKGNITLRDFLAVVFRRLPILIIFILLIPLAVYGFCKISPPVYQTAAKVIVTAKKENTGLLVGAKESGSSAYINLNVDETDLNSEMEILLSMDLWKETVEKLGLDFFKSPKGAWGTRASLATGSRMDRETIKETRIREIAQRLIGLTEITSIAKSKVLDISFEYHDAKKAKHILNTHLDTYIPYHLTVYSNPGAQGFFSGQGQEYKTKYEKAEKELIRFKKKWGISEPEKQKTEMIALIGNLEDSLIDVTSNLNQYENMLESLEEDIIPTGQLATSVKRGNENTVITVIATQLLQAQQNRARAEKRYSRQSRDFKAADDSVKQLIERFKDSLQGEVDVLQAKQSSLTNSLKEVKEQLLILEEKSEEAKRLELAATIAKERYLKYVSKEEEARLENLMRGNKLVNVNILSRPFLPMDPVFPKTKLFTLASLLISIPLGLGVVFTLNFIDHTFDNPEELQEVTGYPTLASLKKI
jgi:uncharacterized protein involved in exopolysaccharide biosynthesis